VTEHAEATFLVFEPEEELPFVVRAFEPGDKHYVLDSWLKSRLRDLRQKYPRRRMTIADRHRWFQESRPAFARSLEAAARDGAVVVACDPEAPTRILGWLIGPPHDYSHVKAWCNDYRDLILGALTARMEASQ
jgi:hypothetical protein